MTARIDRILEQGRVLGKLLLAYAIGGWILYLLFGMVLTNFLATGNPALLLLALVAALPTPLLLTRRGVGKNPARLRQEWEALDRSDAGELAAFLERLKRRSGVSAAVRSEWEERLVDAWHALPAALTSEDAANLVELLQVRHQIVWIERDLLIRASSQAPPVEALCLWNRADADGLSVDAESLDQLCLRLLKASLPRGLRDALPLLLKQARNGHEGCRELITRSLQARRLRPAEIPQDLEDLLPLAEKAAMPSQHSIDAAAASSSSIVSRSVQRMVRGLGAMTNLAKPGRRADGIAGILTRVNSLRKHPWTKWAAVGVAILLALWISRGLDKNHGEVQAPPVSALTWSPPGNAMEGFTIQILSSRDSAKSVDFLVRLHDEGLYAYLLPPRQNSSWYRVRLGWFAERAAADSVAGLLREKGRIDEWYVANFDLNGRLHETLVSPPSARKDSTSSPTRIPARTPRRTAAKSMAGDSAGVPAPEAAESSTSKDGKP